MDGSRQDGEEKTVFAAAVAAEATVGAVATASAVGIPTFILGRWVFGRWVLVRVVGFGMNYPPCFTGQLSRGGFFLS